MDMIPVIVTATCIGLWTVAMLRVDRKQRRVVTLDCEKRVKCPANVAGARLGLLIALGGTLYRP